MKRVATTLAALAFCLPAAAQVEFTHMSGAGTDIRRTDIAPGIYQFMTMRDSYVRQLNSTVIVTDKDVLVFDSTTRPSTSRLIIAEIRKITDKPVRFLVNSHNHPDHWSGNEAYADAFPDLEIIASEKGVERMRLTAPLWAPRFNEELKRRQAAFAAETSTGKNADGTSVAPDALRQDESDLRDYASFVDETNKLHYVFPNTIYGDRLTLTHGGREFRFMSVTGDAEGTTVLYLPKEKILITGDAVSYPISYVSDHPYEELSDLKMLSQLDVNTIVPGHGPAFHDKAFLLQEIALFESVIDGVAKARAGGAKTVEDFQKAVTVDELREKFAHGDSDLEQRFTARVNDLVAFVVAEGATHK